MKIIIPMAGNGSRFAEQGYTDPKPFIDVNGKPMIQRVVESINLPQHEYIFVCKKEHMEKYDMRAIFPDLKFDIVELPYTLKGAALSVYLAERIIKQDEDVLIVNSDQLFTYNSDSVESAREAGVDGAIWCFYGTGSKWSYARLDTEGYVVEVAEKKQISQFATGGMYYWKSFHNFMKCVDRMIVKEDMTNGEYYVAPVYNHMSLGQKVTIKLLGDIDQLGTPEELKAYEDKVRIR